MIDNTPNIHLFKLYKKCYLYDVNTNNIISIPNKIYSYLYNLINKKEEVYLENKEKEYIEKLYKNGFLKPINNDVKIKHFETDYLEEYYLNSLSTLTLQVTQNCNLRCAYCVYSGSYENRIHNNKRMDWETAKKSIEFLHKHSKYSNKISIGFYGGEPLLEWDLIVKSVTLAEELFKDKELSFTITTNATVLKEHMLKFLFEEHNFNVTISLDGPKDIQNSNRIFSNGNKNTFEVVMEKLQMIEKLNKNYLDKISFNDILDLNENLSGSNEFFMSYDLVKDISVMGNYINENNKKEKNIDIPKYYVEAQYETFKSYIYYSKNILNNYKPKISNVELADLKRRFFERMIVNSTDLQQDSPAGQCLPGVQRFFVTAYGKFYPCERVNEQSEDLCIGDIDNGFNLENAKRLLNIGQIIEEQCKKCWCFKLCNQCVSLAEKDGKISKSERLSHCSNIRKGVEHSMKDYIALKTYGLDFNLLEEI